MDYSFLRLKDNLTDAVNIGDSPVVTNVFYNIQLLPDKTYCQITNVDGGLSIDNDAEIFVIDVCGNVLSDITDKVFIEEFFDGNGDRQLAIEYVNLNVDFYRTPVCIKFKQILSNAEYFTNPFYLTSYQSERTVFFKYKNIDDFMSIGYSNAQKFQSISLMMYFDIPIDESEVSDYFQISTNNLISARALIKDYEQYKIEQINRFTFVRLNLLLKHEIVYIDDVRITNKPIIESSERLGDSNYFASTMVVDKNYKDVSGYDFQLFTGFRFIDFIPKGFILPGVSLNLVAMVTNQSNINIESGNIRLYQEGVGLLATYNVNDFQVSTTNLTNDTIRNVIAIILPNTIGRYYFNVDAGIVSWNGILSEAITDSTTWAYEIKQGDYNSGDYNAIDYFLN